eukprot:COSAG01_NODE_7987_length_2963_cov_2.214036_4_plen_67_part_00
MTMPAEQGDADIETLCGAVAALQVGAHGGGGACGGTGAAAGAARVERVAQLQGACGGGFHVGSASG